MLIVKGYTLLGPIVLFTEAGIYRLVYKYPSRVDENAARHFYNNLIIAI
jgi:hypothetical protein